MLAPFTFSGWVSRCSPAGLSGNRLRRELDHIVADGAVLERFLSFLGRRFGSSFQTSGFMEAMIRRRRIEASRSQTAPSVAEVGTLGSEGSEESKLPRRSRGTLERRHDNCSTSNYNHKPSPEAVKEIGQQFATVGETNCGKLANPKSV